MRGIVVMGLCGLLLAGCASDGATSAAPTQAANDDATCRSYGTFPGTTPYVQCRIALRKMAQEQASNGSFLSGLFGD